MNVEFYSTQSSFSPGFISINPELVVSMKETQPIPVTMSSSNTSFNAGYSHSSATFNTEISSGGGTPSIAPIQHIAVGGIILPIQDFTVDINQIDMSLLVQSFPFIIDCGSSTEVI